MGSSLGILDDNIGKSIDLISGDFLLWPIAFITKGSSLENNRNFDSM